MASPSPSKKTKKDLVNLEGYVNFVGSPRKAKQKAADKKEIEFFEVSVNCENNTVRAVCYDLDRRPLLEKFNKESNSCCLLNAEKSDNDVIILDDTIIKQKKVAFDNKTFEPQITSLMSVLQEIPIWARVSVLGRIYDLQDTSSSSKQKTKLREAKIIDQSNVSRQITFFDHFDEVDEGKVYKITNVMVAKYDKKKVLKVSENSSIQEIHDKPEIPKPATTTRSSEKCSGIVCMVDPKSLNTRFFMR
ncbi:uncharacterized protein [Clytia hemisphaerica]|uniref:Uncharacterized protein n=1 Tax=Clytia hemisphaerica TaxID=252671 RepID=A0A7M6DR71_9CNID